VTTATAIHVRTSRATLATTTTTIVAASVAEEAPAARTIVATKLAELNVNLMLARLPAEGDVKTNRRLWKVSR
jgi:hypothetical protein